MSKNTGLGKGLGAIFSGDVTRVLDDIQNGQQDERVQEQTRIPVSEIRPNPYQPRKVFDQPALEELSQSIRQHGVFTPVLVKKSVQGYDLIAGERRLRATRMAGLQEIPAIIVEMSDQEMMEVALLENIQREDLNVIEEAKAYQQMIRSLNYTQDQLAHRIGKSREHITNTLRLLRLPEDVQEYAVRKELSMGHIRALLSLKNEDQMRRIARMAVSQGLSVRKVDQLVRQENMKKPEKISPEDDMFVKDAAKKLEGFFQTGVRISGSSVSIHYENDEDLTRILDLLGLTEKEA